MVDSWSKVKSCDWKNTEGGFTLVELLFAIFIFAIVISSVYGSYSATFRIVHGAESQIKIAHTARFVLERISEDLGSLVIGPDGDLLGEAHDYSGGRGDSLSFVSSAHIALSKKDDLAGNALIQYSTEPDTESGLLNLYRSDSVFMPGIDASADEVEKHLLCEGLLEISFTYIDEEGRENDEWQSSENGADGDDAAQKDILLPILIYVELKFAESIDSEKQDVFKTAVAIPKRQKK